ncbi:MAG TPA: 3-hydroxyacyl-CoA dehydrogenase NAD-binding domain-containing protein, partial [Flavisolibacter sp.]|nr:3-hydroxyacyl-CoA dehydrogenase NAD-binding domain-containing protein [Flavisolibacter sp.]
MKTICICGAGTMGSGIAQVSAAAGLNTILYDLNTDILEKARQKTEKDLQQLVDKHKISAEKKAATLDHLHFTADIEECIADVVIEAV